jgi:hypothetical protein
LRLHRIDGIPSIRDQTRKSLRLNYKY